MKIRVMSDKTGFIGKNYNDVKESLEKIGFSDIEAQEIDTGWGKGNTVADITIDGSSEFSTSDRFDSNAKVIMKYYSNDRVDVTRILSRWSEQESDSIRDKLEAEGFSKVSTFEQMTNKKDRNLLASEIRIEGSDYSDGGCYIQKDTQIDIGKNILNIIIGESASDFEGENYKEVIKRLEGKGFTNISLYRTDDLWIVDLIHDEGDIKRISINENDDFDENTQYRYDADIKIVVITHEGSGCEDITMVA